MVVISVIFGSFLRIPTGGIPYPIFSYTAILPWTLFAGAITAAIPSIIGNMNLVTKIYFPREIIPLAASLARLFDFFIALIVFIGLMIWYKIPLQSTIWFAPVLLIIQITLALGIGLLGAAVGVFLRDILYAIPMLMLVWMYATPVIYPISMVPPEWQQLYMLNPMASIIDGYRKVVLEGVYPDFSYIIYSAIVSVVLLIIGYVYFKKLEMSMADII
jgi:lipopolysaccharide transport system permease protein